MNTVENPFIICTSAEYSVCSFLISRPQPRMFRTHFIIVNNNCNDFFFIDT